MTIQQSSQSTFLGYGFADTLIGFLETDPSRVLGSLTVAASRRRTSAVEAMQVHAWTESLGWLRDACEKLRMHSDLLGHPHVCLEFEIPRRGGRIDAVLLVRDLVFVLEFKSTRLDLQAKRQAEDYGLELFDFHEGSEGRKILPVVCSSGGAKSLGVLPGSMGVATVSSCSPSLLAETILDLFHLHHETAPRSELLGSDWLSADYAPTPTIIEAARALYAGHQVGDLSNSGASREHLERSFQAIISAVNQTLANGDHAIVFLTGIPGAGKTLAGMNVVHGVPDDIKAAFLSGNGPLVSVLQDVLARDRSKRLGGSKKAALHETRTLVQNVHRWLDEYIDRQPGSVPFEAVVVFDEAQRAWDRAQSMRKFQRDASEPEMILEVMQRRREGGVIVALIGGGQEINTGEAGLAEWGRALLDRFAEWKVFVSPQLLAGDVSTAGSCLFPDESAVPSGRVTEDAGLHLRVSQRSFRSSALTEWVELVLSGQATRACLKMESIKGEYPIVMTRDLELARAWLRKQARGERRMGLLASSGARRLRQYGISVAERVNEVNWFLNPPEDVRSSDFLELALSEFGVQGLELDWACLAWGGDFTRASDEWDIRRFRGTRWESVRKEVDQSYVLNRYRVLLTRAREGMVIWVPPGSPFDQTRSPARFDEVADFLTECGVSSI